jgi:uncharacterized protein involved in high-affinity Fe2+ transport
MNIRKLLVLALIGFCAAAVITGCSQKENQTAEAAKPAETVAAAEEAGFDEFPIGDDIELGPLNVAGVYFQPVDMVPASMGLPAAQSDVHMEADISALENDLGYGVGDFVPNLTVKYELSQASGWKSEGTFMPMSASDGPHYGANLKLNGVGEYKVRFLIQNPEAQGYVLHVDKTTGVEGRFWDQPLVAEWTFTYPGPSW